MLTIFFNKKDSGIKISRNLLPFHTPKKMPSERAWEIVDDETGEVVDSYTPPRKEGKQKPDTPFAGSWASQVNRPGFMSKSGNSPAMKA